MAALDQTGLRAVRLDGGFDVEALRADLGKVPDELWTPILTHRRLAWYGVALRSADGDPRTMRYSERCIDTELMAQLASMHRIVAGVPGDLRRVRLLALQPGAKIGVHTDEPEGTTREARLHIPIVTNEQATFTVSGEDVAMAPGDLWWLNVYLPHSARNLGSEPRVHLVIDCVHAGWLDERLR